MTLSSLSLYLFVFALIFCVGAVVLLLWFVFRIRSENRHLRGQDNNSRLPTVEELRNGRARSLLLGERDATLPRLSPSAAPDARSSSKYSRLKHLQFVIELVEPRAEKGILQEEAVLSALHDRIVNRTDWFRESSSIAILSGLAITFFMLAQTMPKEKTISAENLMPILSLVGATWPLVAAGLILYLFSTFWQKLVWDHYDAWRHWLETIVFPELGASRSTLKKLDATLEEFTKVAREITTLLMPIQGLSPALATFQGDLINRLVPAIKDGLSRVSVGLSDEALHELRKAGADSLRAVREIQDNQARILSISIAAERNVTEIAASVIAVAKNAQAVASSLENHAPALQANSAAVAKLDSELNHSVSIIATSARGLINAVTANREAVESSHAVTAEMTADLRALRPELSTNSIAVRALSTSMAQMQKSMEATEQLLALIPTPLSATAECLPMLVENLNAVQSRWTEAMLQMASITDEIARRTNTLDEHARGLANALVENNGQLRATSTGLSETHGDLESLRKDIGRLAGGTQDIVTAFRDLQVMAQKLKNLGNTITGHFNIWQHQTKEVFQNAQTTSKSVHESMNGVVKAAETASQRIESSLVEVAQSIGQLESQIHSLTVHFEPQAYKVPATDAGGNGHLDPTAVTESRVVEDADRGAA